LLLVERALRIEAEINFGKEPGALVGVVLVPCYSKLIVTRVSLLPFSRLLDK
jgi:hypothetical protein